MVLAANRNPAMKKSDPNLWSTTLSAAALACVAVLPSVAAAGTALTFKLRNASDYDLTALYVSPSLEDSWGDDLLDADRVAAGAAAEISVAGSDRTCLYDIRFVVADGSLMEEVGVDLCSLENYTLEP